MPHLTTLERDGLFSTGMRVRCVSFVKTRVNVESAPRFWHDPDHPWDKLGKIKKKNLKEKQGANISAKL